MSHPSLETKHGLLAKAGSFWGEGMTEESRNVARRLVHTATMDPCDMLFESCVDWAAAEPYIWVHGEDRTFVEGDIGTPLGLSQERDTVIADGVVVTFRPRTPRHVFDGLGLLFTENTTDYEALTVETGEFLLWPAPAGYTPVYMPSEYRPVWLLPWDAELEAHALLAADGRLLLAGVDFIQSSNTLIFNAHPLHLFPEKRITVQAGRRWRRAIHSFTMKLEGVAGPTERIADWQRDKQSPKALKLALAQVCGRVICPADTVIQSVVEDAVGARYLCDGFSLTVPYDHTLLAAGTSLEKDEIIGGGLNIFKGRSGSYWWRALDWSAGLSMDTMCPISGLTIPDAQIRLDSVDATGGNYHVRPWISGDAANLGLYWRWLKFSENTTGVYLDEVVGLGAQDDIHYANGIDFYFSNLLGLRAMVVQLPSTLDPLTLRRAQAFLKQESPLGVVIVRVDG